MKRLLWLLLAVVLVGPALLFLVNMRPASPREITLTARMPESGGWSQDSLELQVGQEVVIRLTSDDVVHGFAIGGLDLAAADIEPGKWTELHWTPSQPGEYTFYCTRWCGANHWRMTGTVHVVDPSETLPTPTPAGAPRFQLYGLDIDMRPTNPELSGIRPSAQRGSALQATPSQEWLDPMDADLTMPATAWTALRQDPALTGLDEGQVWDLVASLWMQRIDGEKLEQGQELYQANCQACHGPAGNGQGVMATHFDDPPVADFTDLGRMATASSVILEGKILRGGMGTGMPYWGGILRPGEILAVVDYLWSLTFAGR